MRWEMKKVGGHNQGIIKNERGKKWRRKVGKRNGRGTEVEEGQRERSRKGKEVREKKK